MVALAPTIRAFGASHPLQIAITAGLVIYSLAKKKLTPDGIVAAVVTAVVHMLHPWSVFFYLLVTFFMAGTIATKVHHRQKSLLTQSSVGGTSDETSHGRSASQVLANSLPASLFILLHLYTLRSSASFSQGFSAGRDLLPVGIIASYAAATADTLSSELGILSLTPPFLITPPFSRVPPGTNGGVTTLGLLWGLFGGALMALTSIILLPFTPSSSSSLSSKLIFFILISLAGLFGSVLDSVLGATVQVTVEDKKSGRVVEGENGRRVIVDAKGAVGDGENEGQGSRRSRGRDLLNNNGVNFGMSAGTGVVAMGFAWAFGG